MAQQPRSRSLSPPGLSGSTAPVTPSPLRFSTTPSSNGHTPPDYVRRPHNNRDDQDETQQIPLLPISPASPPGQETEGPPHVDDVKDDENPLYVDPFARPGGFVWRRSQHRPPYLSLSEAIYDDSQPEFDAMKLYRNFFSDPVKDSISKPQTKTPSLYPRGLPKPAKKHPFAQGFEPPRWRLLWIHVGLCLLAYPFLLIFVILARGRSLFWARFFVGVGSGLVGFSLGLSLLRLGRGILEASAWATVIHVSRVVDRPGMRLKDLVTHSDNWTSAWSAFRLLWDRQNYRGTDRDNRRSYDSRPWSLFIFFFLGLVYLAGSLPFILSRLVNIETHVQLQNQNYNEVTVMGALSADDLSRANNVQSIFQNRQLAWTLSPSSLHGGVPPAVSFFWKNTAVFFAEIIPEQLRPNGTGLGTFDDKTTMTSIDPDDPVFNQTAPALNVDPGSVLRFPRWGIRISCAKIPDGYANIVPFSETDMSYLFTPREVLRPLFSSLGRDFPRNLEQPYNFSALVDPLDSLPEALNMSGIALGAKFWNDGMAYNMATTPLSTGEDGAGFVTLENIFVRLNTTFAPEGSFSRLGDVSIPDVNGAPTFIGFDAAVCLELYEPWVVELYNSSVAYPNSLRIVDKAAAMTTHQRAEKTLATDPSVERQLLSSNYPTVFTIAHQSSINQILKDNGRHTTYAPSATLLSYTGGNGPNGYTSLSETLYAQARAMADARNVLPYFAGSGLLLAFQYPDSIVTSVAIFTVPFVVTLIIVCLVGVLAALFVPRLPLSVPRRGFGLYSWVAAFYAKEFVSERTPGIEKNMDLEEIEDQIGAVRFRYVS